MSESLERYLERTYFRFFETNNVREKIFIRRKLLELLSIFPNDSFLVNTCYNFGRELDRKIYNTKQVENYMDEEYKYFFEENKQFINKIIPLDKGINKKTKLKEYHINTLMQILYSFLSTISSELCNYVQEKNQSGELLIGNYNCYQRCQDYNGFVGVIGGKELTSYIYVNKMNDLLDLMVLIHEIGHAYFQDLNNIDFHYFDDTEQLIKNEIPSRMMEILFIRYLGKMGMKKEARELMKAFNTHITKEQKGYNNYVNLKYRIGSFVGSQYADSLDTYYLEDIFRFIYQTDFRLLLQKSSKHFDGFSIDYDLDDNFVKIFNSL